MRAVLLLMLAACAVPPHAIGGAPIALWPAGAVPDAQPTATPEDLTTTSTELFAGRPLRAKTNIAHPTMTIYPPRAGARATGAAVIVFPGGGYKGLALDLEGTEVCDWLTGEGITCVVLEYRVPFSGPYWDDSCKCHVTPPAPLALEDAQRAIGLVRARAAALHVDPHRIGVLGFSAGGHLVANVSTHGDARAYAPIDAADRESSRPDFAIALYPGHLWTETALELAPDIATHITARTPATLLLQAEDDGVDDVEHSLAYFEALKRAGVPAELHVYAHGGHAFGLRPTADPITRWPALAMTWLHTIGVL